MEMGFKHQRFFLIYSAASLNISFLASCWLELRIAWLSWFLILLWEKEHFLDYYKTICDPFSLASEWSAKKGAS